MVSTRDSHANIQAGLRPPAACLAALLPARFRAADGFHREAGGVQLMIAFSPGRSPGQLDLVLRFVSGRWQELFDSPPATDLTVPHALEQRLTSERAQTRSVACQTLGQLGTKTVVPRLLRLASEDEDAFVRQVATEAIGRIESSGTAMQHFIQLGLTLTYSAGPLASAGTTSVNPVFTDEHAVARFSGIPADADCELALLMPEPCADRTVQLAELAQQLRQLQFSDQEPIAQKDGGCCITVQPHATDDPATFSTLLRMVPIPELLTSRFLPGLALHRGDEYWPPSVAPARTGLFWFHRLPRGSFRTRLSDDWPGQRPPRPCLYALSDSAFPGPRPGAPAEQIPSAQIVHPPDRRLVAIVERDRQGCIVLTVETAAPELRQARVRYLLGTEHGEFGFCPGQTPNRLRAAVRLQQVYRGDEATRLALQVAPYPDEPESAAPDEP